MAIETTCGGCGKLLSVGDEHAGRRARCPACGQIYTIPALAAPGAAPDVVTQTGSIVGASGSEDQTVGPPQLPPSSDSTFASQSPDASSSSSAAASMEQFWMRTPEGAEYGPVDRATLDRWYREGRVGGGYMIRQSESGFWQPAEAMRANLNQPRAFAATPSSSANPYAATAAGAAFADNYRSMYPKADQSGMVLAFGILSWFLCPIFGIVAWVMGQAGLKDIAAGLVDPANKGIMQAGYYLGMVHVILIMVCFGAYVVFVAFAVILGAVS